MLKKGIVLFTAAALTVSLLAACGNAKPETGSASASSGQETEAQTPPEDLTPTPEPTEEPTPEPTEEPDDGTKTLREFCNDEEVDAWFDSLSDEPPVMLTFWIYGEAPFSMDFTDEDLIMKTAAALQTVTIDGLSDENPDWVDDAGGTGYYFEMADGSRMSFHFMMGCFQWNDSEYHDVASFGDLTEVNEELERIGNPQYVAVYADDDGFYTTCLETYETAFVPEDGVTGGLFIYLGDEGVPPYIAIGRCADETPDDPEGYLTDHLVGNIRDDLLADTGIGFEEAGEVQEYEFGGKSFTGQKFNVISEDGSEILTMLVLVLKTRDSLLDEDHLVRFYATYDETDEEQAEKMETALNNAAHDFYLKRMWYESGEAQPGNTLFDFINDAGVTAWYEKALEQTPDELVVTTDTWHSIEDPEMIHKVLLALATVVIGDEAEETVGGSGRQIYDFMDMETGNGQSFDFFEDQFSYGMENYMVLDWGDLDELLPELEK